MPTPPNIIVLITHDTGRHLGCYGVDTVHTPHIDRLAGEGVRFTRYFAAAANCSPSRGAMFSGQWPASNGVMGLVHSPNYWRYKPGVKHLSDHLRAAGYHNVAVGHIHEAFDPAGTLAFDEHLKGNKASDVIREVPAKLAELAQGEQPFYMQIGTHETHTPYLIDGVEPDSSKGVFVPPNYVRNEASTEEFAAYQGSIRRADEAVGALLDAIDAHGLRDNTLVVYGVDHGIPYPRAKNFVYDAGLETAHIIRWPNGGIGGGRTCDHLLSNVDFAPTVLALAGLSVPAEMQGVSYAQACRDEHAPPVRDAVYAQHWLAGGGPRAIRTDRYKLIYNLGPSRSSPPPYDLASPPRMNSSAQWETPIVELYDLHADPGERENLAASPDHADVLRDLSRRLHAHLQRSGDAILQAPVPSPRYDAAISTLRETAV